MIIKPTDIEIQKGNSNFRESLYMNKTQVAVNNIHVRRNYKKTF